MMKLFSLLCCLALLAGCSRDTVINVTNNSSGSVSNVIVSGNGFTNALGTIDSRTTRKVSVHPAGESGVRLTFTSGGRQFNSGDREYVEAAGYSVSLTIEPDLSIVSDSALRQE